MRTVRDNVVVKADGPNDHVTLKDGKKLWIDTSFDPQRHAVISGIVQAAGPKVKDLKKDDRVYFHFNCYRDDFRLFHGSDDLIRVPYELIYCKISSGKMEMMDDMLLATPIENDEKPPNNVIVPNRKKYKDFHAKITHLPKNYVGELEVGDTVIYEPDSDIPINIEGTKYYRMNLDWIQAKLIN